MYLLSYNIKIKYLNSMASMKLIKTTPLGKLKEAHWLFLLLSLLFGLFYIFATPLFWGLDESAHFSKVYQITHGKAQYGNSQADYSGKLPVNLLKLFSYSHKDLSNNVSVAYGRKDVDNIEEYRSLTSQKFSKEESAAYGIANYSPIAYVGPILGGVIANIFNFNIEHTVYLERIFSLTVYMTIVGAALYLLRKYKVRWFILLTAILPTSLFNGSMITADTMLISSSILAFSLFIRYLTSEDRQLRKKIFYALLLICFIIPLIKVNYAFLSAGILLALPLNKIYSRQVWIKIITAAGVFVVALAWYAFSGGIGNPSQNQLPEGVTSSADQMNFVTHHPVGFATAFIRSIQVLGDSYIATGSTIIGWNYISVPIAVSTVILVIILTTLTIGMKELTQFKKYFIVPALFSILGVGSVFLALYLAHTPTGLPYIRGVQGRYLIPFMLPIAALIAGYSKIEFNKRESEKYIVKGGITISLLILIWTALIYISCTY
jgi:uncharacterized membrane protein